MRTYGLAIATAFLGLGAQAWAAPPPVEDYGKLPNFQELTISPSGTRYAFVARIDGARRLVVLTNESKVIEAGDIGNAKIEGVEWAGDDHLLVHTSSTVELGMTFAVSKTELDGVVAVDLAHHKSFAVFGNVIQHRVANTVVGSYGAAQVGGRWYGYFGGYTYDQDHGGQPRQDDNGQLYPDLYRVDLDTGTYTLAAQGQPGISGWLVSPDGKVAARLIYNEVTGDWRLTASGWGGATIASGRSLSDRVSLIGFGRTPATVLMREPGADHNIIKEWPLAGGPAISTLNADDIGAPLFDPVTALWIGSEAESGSAPDFFNPIAKARVKGAFKAFPGYVTKLVSYSADFGHLIVFTDGGDDSGSFWLVDIATGSAQVIGGAYPTVTPADVGPVRWFDYKAGDGTEMRGVLTLPPGKAAKALPLVVMPHGGPEAHDEPGFDYWAQAFASRGYAVFQPNFRGSTGSGNAFRDAGFGQWGRKMQTDISDGVAELAKQGIADPKRACIVGASYGGYAALAGVTVQHGLYRCAVSYGGVADLGGMLRYETERAGGFTATTRYWKQFMGVKTFWQTELNEISPIRLADRADAPILLIHGKDDTVVTIDQSQSMEQALRKAGKPVELITYPGTDHWLLEENSRVEMLKASVAFVMKNNPPDAAPTAVAKGP
jgi:dipeptidyl aminopeptidase/acylaminoacyl peptidase